MEVESIPVVIVGAGPSGLVLGLCSAHYHVHSIILEKEVNVADDPRGVFLAADALRVLWQIGIEKDIPSIGHEVDAVHFHKSNFQNPSLLTLDVGRDWVHQTVPSALLKSQPKLERCLRRHVEESPFCTLRSGCEVVDRREVDDGVIVFYLDNEKKVTKQISCQWLVGADGKRSTVRKDFLEPSADIRQGPGLVQYDGTWVAANLHIRLPTPETHPELPLWELGYTPEQVYEMYWPQGWHFCTPPGRATACGRFGPHQDRLWRHEFAVSSSNDSMDAESLLWAHLTPMITRREDQAGRRFPGGAVPYPRDCIEIWQCRPYTFSHRVVNRWFDHRTILIGDAAHVFPPFGGQGITCGIRDAEGLAWRLALLFRISPVFRTLCDEVLNTWARERRQGVNDGIKLTVLNGDICNNTESWGTYLLRNAVRLYEKIPLLPSVLPPPPPPLLADAMGYMSTKDGFFLAEHGGGPKLAQICMQTVQSEELVLSDTLLRRVPTVMALLVMGDNNTAEKDSRLKRILNEAGLNRSIISEESIVYFCTAKAKARAAWHRNNSSNIFFPAPAESLTEKVHRRGYNAEAFMSRLGGSSTRYAILRPDGIIFALAKSVQELEECLYELKRRLT